MGGEREGEGGNISFCAFKMKTFPTCSGSFQGAEENFGTAYTSRIKLVAEQKIYLYFFTCDFLKRII